MAYGCYGKILHLLHLNLMEFIFEIEEPGDN
jgi:hypothetical protein